MYFVEVNAMISCQKASLMGKGATRRSVKLYKK